ncbi:DMT family transporter [Actinomycetospora sp. TBRC 11914]|uniref:DMT family transporter n=1 Tax=Actinomycetospora sp. TBRC 11914 TaxID=2729387 RepID=UPI00145E8132|nr:DMT family transporter [Actinomycetospora sp. TBRC 11914]NMO90930.1 DMT family transporter [Actinomycetospora sp. TBRC 11914]
MLLTGLGVATAAAAANALGSVLQRSASRHHDPEAGRRRAVLDLLRRPAWTAGIAGHVVGFVLQAVALTLASISVVQPMLITELPFTLVLSAVLLHTPMGRRAWTAIAVMALGLALLLFCLVPSGGDPAATSGPAWFVGSAIVVAVLVVLALLGRGGRGRRRALWFGLGAGVTYGYNAALLAGLGPAYAHGVLAVLTTWQTYGVLIGGIVSFVFLQQALQAHDLLWAQPGITLANPLVAMTWGFAVFGDRAPLDAWTLGGLVGAVGIVAGTVVLSRVEHAVVETDGAPSPAPHGAG